MSTFESQEQLDELLTQVYDDLRKMASHQMRQERDGHTLQTTALVHEAYLRLSGLDEIQWDDERHVLRTAVAVMRRVLIDFARRKKARKRDIQELLLGGTSGKFEGHQDPPCFGVLALHEALERLRELDATKADIVELRYFGGQTLAAIADALGLSLATVKRQWTFARAWLYRELGD